MNLRSYTIGAMGVAVFLLIWTQAGTGSGAEAEPPCIQGVETEEQGLSVRVHIPFGYRYALLEGRDGEAQSWQPLIVGELYGNGANARFSLKEPRDVEILRIRAGTEPEIPWAPYRGEDYVVLEFKDEGFGGNGGDLWAQEPGCSYSEEQKIGHLLNRLAYGPSSKDVEKVENMGLKAYVEDQLADPSEDESLWNPDLAARLSPLFEEFQPAETMHVIDPNSDWRIFKGTEQVSGRWTYPGFNDSNWILGGVSVGYGDDDDRTVLEDMRRRDPSPADPGTPGYVSVYIRKSFEMDDWDEITNLFLRIDYDDGFVAYLNGVEVARENVGGNPPLYDREAEGNHEAGSPEEFDLSNSLYLLRSGENVLAVQGHNVSLYSSDFTLKPELIRKEYLPGPSVTRIKDIEALQQLIHLRGVYAERQLQAVLGEFWENHFTTDYDKVVDYLEDLRNSDARRAISKAQAEMEAAQMELYEYNFFHRHALGNFGDLLLFSATSPAQLIYLDNVLNRRGEPNENYAREIFELFGFGVDNRYTQRDIEELARCFTGWTIKKMWPSDRPSFPESARSPPIDPSVKVDDQPIIDRRANWKYFKGEREPSPGPGGEPTLAWTFPAFDAQSWNEGILGIGYGDGDDATVLNDMRGDYVSIYIRHEFTLENLENLDHLLLSVAFDDGFVAYLNGVEVARSSSMEGNARPPAFHETSMGSHEVTRGIEEFSLSEFESLLLPAPSLNVLALQVHNVSLNSSDLSIYPRLVLRNLLPGSIENGNPNGVWTFRFNPEQHDAGEKRLFEGTEFAMRIPGGRTGQAGVLDAIDVIDGMISHPSTAEFICIKLINRFVSDEITLQSYKDGSAPAPLIDLLDRMIAEWRSTSPQGNIRTVMTTMIDASSLSTAFWSDAAWKAKIKTPVEFINSTLRVLKAEATGAGLPELNEQLGMEFFVRNDPDGWSEMGLDWMDTGTLLARTKFAQGFAANRFSGMFSWDTADYLLANDLQTAAEIVDHFDRLLFQGTLPSSHREVLIRFVESDTAGHFMELDPLGTDYIRRVQSMVGLILSAPEWQYQ